MPDVRPFRGLRYASALSAEWGALLGPPYDAITQQQRRALLARSPYQITHIESPDGPDGVRAAAERLREWRREGVLLPDPDPCFYLARHAFTHAGKARVRHSLFGAVRLTPWEQGDVRPHEWTIAGPRAERESLRGAARADISPAFGIVPDRSGEVGKLLEHIAQRPPSVSGVDANGEEHTLWLADDRETIDALQQALAREPLYVADGHHRYESALDYRDRQARAAASWDQDKAENRILMGLVRADDPGLIVGATHRIAHGPPPGRETLDRVRARFQIESLGLLDQGVAALLDRMAAAMGPVIGAVGLPEGETSLLRPTERTSEQLPRDLPASWRRLDVALLQFGLLEPVLGIDAAALRAGAAIDYTPDAAEAFAAVTQERAPLAFLLNPPALAQIFASADSGDRMPQKSTYFTPKLPTGVVLHAFD